MRPALSDHTYATASKVATDADQFSMRIDHKFSAKDQFFARFNFDNLSGPTTNPDQTAIDPSFGVEYIDRQRNVVGTYTHEFSQRFTFESSLSIQRTTPGFPTPNYTDPAVKFNDGLFEAFNSAAGTVMQAYGNLFQLRENRCSMLRGIPSKRAARSVKTATAHILELVPMANTTLEEGPHMSPEA